MNATSLAPAAQGRYARSLDRRLSPQGVRDAFAHNANDRKARRAHVDPEALHRDLEELTVTFREEKAKTHDHKARVFRGERQSYDDPIAAYASTDDEWNRTRAICYRHDVIAAENAEKWHSQRATGQRDRFVKVRRCGDRMMIASCKTCCHPRRAVPEGCGVRRVCDRCDVAGAAKRRARFGRARGRSLLAAVRYGLLRANRRGGAYTEKMLTLTVPHCAWEDAGALVREIAANDIEARIVALFLAWPRFLKKLNRFWRRRWEFESTYHRAFEWTIGRNPADTAGHPHFHVYMHCAWIDVRLVRAWWAESLRAIGWPVKVDDEGRDVVSVDLKKLHSFNEHAIRELLKGGRESALKLSKVIAEDGTKIGAGIDAFKYADGWTIGDVIGFCSSRVVADLYCALEGRRLTQASRAFFEGDDPPMCEGCKAYGFVVWFQPHDAAPAADACSHVRGPPYDPPPS